MSDDKSQVLFVEQKEVFGDFTEGSGSTGDSLKGEFLQVYKGIYWLKTD